MNTLRCLKSKFSASSRRNCTLMDTVSAIFRPLTEKSKDKLKAISRIAINDPLMIHISSPQIIILLLVRDVFECHIETRPSRIANCVNQFSDDTHTCATPLEFYSKSLFQLPLHSSF